MIQRLNWGCGRSPLPGWINSDRSDETGVDLCCDICEGLPLETDSIEYAVSYHALQEIAYENLNAVLSELRRVLKPGGVLRLCLPDLDKGIAAYQSGNSEHFFVPDTDSATLGGKFIIHMLWYGHSRTLFTFDFVRELLLRAGFQSVTEVQFMQTGTQFPDITTLDDRERESIFVEATK